MLTSTTSASTLQGNYQMLYIYVFTCLHCKHKMNIQVNAIVPGWIETDMTVPVHTMPLNDEILARTRVGRWGQPEETAGTAVYLASRASDFVTGTTIRVDGGYAIR